MLSRAPLPSSSTDRRHDPGDRPDLDQLNCFAHVKRRLAAYMSRGGQVPNLRNGSGITQPEPNKLATRRWTLALYVVLLPVLALRHLSDRAQTGWTLVV